MLTPQDKAFKCPFKMYTDPTLRLYRTLGLTRQTGDAGLDEDKGDYLVQTAMEQTVQTLKRATKMPLRVPGHFTQLGGEFVFDGPLNVTYTHRMVNTRSHAPIRDVVAEAGVRLEFIHYEPGPPPPPVHRASPIWGINGDRDDDTYDLGRWQAEREAQLERIRALKSLRREGRFGSASTASSAGIKDLALRRGSEATIRIVNEDEAVTRLASEIAELGVAM
jgi:hypothetical protein